MSDAKNVRAASPPELPTTSLMTFEKLGTISSPMPTLLKAVSRPAWSLIGPVTAFRSMADVSFGRNGIRTSIPSIKATLFARAQ